MNLSPEDFELARQFAGTLERTTARRSVDELTEADLLAIDKAYATAKDTGALDRARDQRATEHEVHMLRCTGRL